MNESPNKRKIFFPNELICCSSITGSLDRCILKFKRKQDFARLNFSFKKFQETRTKPLFWVSKKACQLVISQYFKSRLTEIIHWPYHGIIIESSKCSENKNGQNYRNQDIGEHFFQITVMPQILWNRYNSTLRWLLDMTETSLNAKCEIEGFSSFQSVLAHCLGY